MEEPVTQVGVLNRSDARLVETQSGPTFAARLRAIRAVFFVGIGLLATVAWIALLGWLLYRAVLVVGSV